MILYKLYLVCELFIPQTAIQFVSILVRQCREHFFDHCLSGVLDSFLVSIVAFLVEIGARVQNVVPFRRVNELLVQIIRLYQNLVQ